MWNPRGLHVLASEGVSAPSVQAQSFPPREGKVLWASFQSGPVSLRGLEQNPTLDTEARTGRQQEAVGRTGGLVMDLGPALHLQFPPP